MAGSQIKQPRYSLESVAIFRGLSSPALERIKLRCSCRRYEPREWIVGHLDTSDEVFFLLTGSARVTVRSADGKAVNFRELSSGGMFGEYAAIDGRPRSANVEARTSCLVVSMPADAFRELLGGRAEGSENSAGTFRKRDPGTYDTRIRIQHARRTVSHPS